MRICGGGHWRIASRVSRPAFRVPRLRVSGLPNAPLFGRFNKYRNGAVVHSGERPDCIGKVSASRVVVKIKPGAVVHSGERPDCIGKVSASRVVVKIKPGAVVHSGERPDCIGKVSASRVVVKIKPGAVVHSGERLICIQEVAGSNPTGSTTLKLCFTRIYCRAQRPTAFILALPMMSLSD